MALEGLLQVSLASVMEDVLKQHGTRFCDTHLASRRAEEGAARRHEASVWLRMAVGDVAAKDLPDEPSEEEFRFGLRNGLILCNALNEVHPGAVPRVVMNLGDPCDQPDGAALSAYQYFENVRNFLVAAREIGLPTFDASDLEKGGKSDRIVNCVLALKSFDEWKKMGGHGPWRYSGNLKPLISGKPFQRKTLENSQGSSIIGSNDGLCSTHNSHGEVLIESSEMTRSGPLHMLVRTALSNKKPEELPLVVESLLNKIMQEFERRIASQNELVKTGSQCHGNGTSFVKENALIGPCSSRCQMEEIEESTLSKSKKEVSIQKTSQEEISREKLSMQQLYIEQQKRDIQELKLTLSSSKAGVENMQMRYTEEFAKLGQYVHRLSHAALGYHKVLEENRKLYNQVQDLKGSIRVYCRVRPFLSGQLSSNTVSSFDDGTISIITPSKYGKEGRRSFNFNKVFGPSASQEQVFSDTQPLIRSILDGYNVCIFAYGQTGSGKTYTMSGPKVLNEQTVGVNYRAVSDLFELAEQRRGVISYEVAVQMIEIYNEQVRDLLSDSVNRKLEIRNSSEKGVNVPNANLVPVASTSEVMELMSIGQKNRAVGATALNDRSSRSHSCLTVHVQGRDATSGAILHGCLHLVDLAGSERVDKSEVTGERLKEAQYINKSLSALGDVISALAQKNSHVPYRNSKLTQLLQDSLGGQAKTLMFVHVSPEMDAIGETLSTLKFAERVSTVELGAARVNKESGEVKELREQINVLKAALARNDEESEYLQNTIPSPDPITIATPSPMRSNRKCRVDLSSQVNHRHPMEEVGNIEVRSSSRMNRFKSGEEHIVMMNKQDTNDNSTVDWEGENETLPDLFYQQCHADMRVHPDEQCQRGTKTRKDRKELEGQRSGSYAVTDDSDDLDIVTSDSSEADTSWQFNLQNVNNFIVLNEGGSRIKKPQPIPAKISEIRTPIRTQLSSSKKSNGPNQTGRFTNSSNSARKQATPVSKTINAK